MFLFHLIAWLAHAGLWLPHYAYYDSTRCVLTGWQMSGKHADLMMCFLSNYCWVSRISLKALPDHLSNTWSLFTSTQISRRYLNASYRLWGMTFQTSTIHFHIIFSTRGPFWRGQVVVWKQSERAESAVFSMRLQNAAPGRQGGNEQVCYSGQVR